MQIIKYLLSKREIPTCFFLSKNLGRKSVFLSHFRLFLIRLHSHSKNLFCVSGDICTNIMRFRNGAVRDVFADTKLRKLFSECIHRRNRCNLRERIYLPVLDR